MKFSNPLEKIKSVARNMKDNTRGVVATALVAGISMIPMKSQGQNTENSPLKAFEELPQLFQRADNTGRAHIEINSSDDAGEPAHIIFNLDKASTEDLEEFIKNMKEDIESLDQQLSILQKCASCQEELDALRTIKFKTNEYLKILYSEKDAVTPSTSRAVGLK